MKASILTILLIILTSANEAFATSCFPLSERIIGKCRVGICVDNFYVKEIKTYGLCSRGPIIQKLPNGAQQALEKEVGALSKSDSEQIYELVIKHRFRSSWNKNRFITNQFTPSKTYKKLGIMHKELNIIKNQSIPELKKHWKQEEIKSRRENIIFKLFDWLVFIHFLMLLFFSVKWFRDWLFKLRSIKFLGLSFLLQSVMFISSIQSIPIFRDLIIELSFSIVLLVWLYELILYSLVKRKILKVQ